jgi:hypothetical protein
MRRSTAILTLNRERVPLAFQAGHAGSIPVTRSTGKSLHSKFFWRGHGVPLVVKRGLWVPSGAVFTTPPRRGRPWKLVQRHGRGQPAAALGSADPPGTYDEANGP